MASHSRPPPPPPPGGPSTSNNTSSGPTTFYASHGSNTSSSAARQRLGLNKKSSRPVAGAAPSMGSGGHGIGGSSVATTGTGAQFYSSSGYDSSAGYRGSGGSDAGGMRSGSTGNAGGMAMTGGGGTSSTSASASSTDDWFGSGPSNGSAAASASVPSAPAPASASGFYGGGSAGAGYPGTGYGGGSTFYGNSAGSTGSNAGYGQYNNTNTSSSGSDFYSNPNNTGKSNMEGDMYGNSSFSDAMNGLIGSAAPSNSLSGPMTSSHSTPFSTPTPSVFDPNAAKQSQSTNAIQPSDEEDYENEPPLLEELGVNFPHIYSKSRAVLFPTSQHAKHLEMDLVQDTDLAGPLAFALGLAGELLLSGKMHFGYVYGFVVSGSIAMTLLLNLLNPNGAVSMWMVLSILGYALLPVNLLAGINIVLRVAKLGWTGMALAMVTIGWCTVASTRLFERGCGMRSQRFLVAYPVALLYSAFVMITIF
mmetsp:Transcript_11598/g.24456  ORF Transcript_11598/g.24456 Transcript_11598/m.24456 type:complete len:477 (-) Transcript_11598:22-1452(-)